ncbi:hypothetical protein [Prevotella sp. OH937_COT-195]|uniref:hypothetical protein n=1 Tax=Prevotella sp. OH937_COT-195 TaxID=2491051 RepID=UPI000F64E191|nr:hypothetical protein [Prevotella sp. OH937_COT-195]RRC98740.1 hypothetical protein EII32_08685 [Prevotella sp. OH937_COT-195]
MKQEQIRYEEWLTTIANTRLVYNTMEELEQFFDNRSIHSNGIKRCFVTQKKLRSAFRDLNMEVELQTDGIFDLYSIMYHYKQAWIFFHNHLYRRANPERIALEIMSYCYSPYVRNGLGNKKRAIFKKITEQEINVPFLILMLMKAIPGYDSKEGDVIDMPHQYECVIHLMEKFVSGTSQFGLLPIIIRAREETQKSRLMLLFYVQQILDIYESYTEPENLYGLANDIKNSTVNLDIAGYWNECGGKLLYTNFWQIENALNNGTYFLTYWQKDADNNLSGIRYSLFIIEGTDGNLIYYILHPEAIKHRMEGLQYKDNDHVWYQTEMLDDTPAELPLQRLMFSGVWKLNINLTRCSDSDVIARYEAWLNHDCKIIKQYQHLEYDFRPNLYAITKTHLYIPSENDGEYYKVPKSSYEGFNRVHISDNVGTMLMNGKIYLAFDEFMLYISTSKNELKKYEIERVNRIE